MLAAVEQDVLNIEVLETALYKPIAALQTPSGHEDRRRELREELAQIEAEATRVAQAIAAGGEIPALVTAMQERERRRSHVRTEMMALER